MIRDLDAIVREFEEDYETRVIILTGQGRAFSVGADFATLHKPLAIQQDERTVREQQAMTTRATRALTAWSPENAPVMKLQYCRHSGWSSPERLGRGGDLGLVGLRVNQDVKRGCRSRRRPTTPGRSRHHQQHHQALEDSAEGKRNHFCRLPLWLWAMGNAQCVKAFLPIAHRSSPIAIRGCGA